MSRPSLSSGSSGSSPSPEASNVVDAAFEIVTSLPGFTSIRKRSGELDGNLPVRAARYCSPVFEGSAAGFQIVLEQPIAIERGAQGELDFNFTPPALDQVTNQVNDALDRAVAAGLLARRGYWDRLFRGNALAVKGKRIVVWTGHFIRPRAGIWPLVGGAFNRRSRVPVVDHLVTDPGRFVPLVVEIDARDIGPEGAWLEGELGCVTPLVPGALMRKERLAPDSPELRAFAEYFSDAYFETKSRHPTATYLRRQRENRVKAAASCDARLLFAGPDVHSVEELARFITEDGFTKQPATPGTILYGLVRNIARVEWTWQGQTHKTFEVHHGRAVAELKALWQEAFGDAHASARDFLAAYMMGEQWDQPYVQLQPWVFVPTAPGWSTLVDGIHGAPAYDGMRAVIATDWFHGLAMVYRMFDSATVSIPYRAPLMRAIPVTRAALDLGFATATL
jgi:hypothetical protein